MSNLIHYVVFAQKVIIATCSVLIAVPAVILRGTETTWTIGVERSRVQFFVNWLRGLTYSILGETTLRNRLPVTLPPKLPG